MREDPTAGDVLDAGVEIAHLLDLATTYQAEHVALAQLQKHAREHQRASKRVGTSCRPRL
jgi:hypothetical protein